MQYMKYAGMQDFLIDEEIEVQTVRKGSPTPNRWEGKHTTFCLQIRLRVVSKNASKRRATRPGAKLSQIGTQLRHSARARTLNAQRFSPAKISAQRIHYELDLRCVDWKKNSVSGTKATDSIALQVQRGIGSATYAHVSHSG
jgi:hypothetical protein